MDPKSAVGGTESSDLPELQVGSMLDVFIPGELKGLVRISKRCPLPGELIQDVTGRYFLAPEEDYRGGGMHSVPVLNLSAQAKTRFVGRVVLITGTFEDGRGITVETIVLQDEPSGHCF